MVHYSVQTVTKGSEPSHVASYVVLESSYLYAAYRTSFVTLKTKEKESEIAATKKTVIYWMLH